MIAIDSSALIAMISGEPDADRFAHGLLTLSCVVGWPTLFETRSVLFGRRSPSAVEALSIWIGRENVRCRSFDEPLYRHAVEAFERFGKGQGSGASLNFGDCLSYAVAKDEDLALLYKGTDFAKTDIKPALP